MKAAIINNYGPPEVLYLKEVPTPTPKDNEILVKVKAVAVTVGDARIRGANFPTGFSVIARLIFGIFKPRNKVLGMSFSGVVAGKGSNVTEFSIDDEVFGMQGIKMGANAEYLTIDQSKAVIKKPSAMSHEEAAALTFGGTTALYFLKDLAKLSKGQTILINGASGAVGTNAVQIAKFYGAEVTGVCSTDNVKLVKSLGADTVIDYKKEKVSDQKVKYDWVMDAVGNLSLDQCGKLLKKNGACLLVVAGLPEILKASFEFLRPESEKDIQIRQGTAGQTKETVHFLSDLVVKKKLKVVIGKTFKFSEIVKAHQYVDTGHKVGNVVLTF